MLDALVVGAGPAGCSAASWLAQLGLRAVLLEREALPCAMLQRLDITQDWVLGEPGASLQALGRHYAEHAQSLPGVDLRLNRSIEAVSCLPTGGWSLRSGSDTFAARCLVLATGVRPRRPAVYFARPDPAGRVMDAATLTMRRAQLAPRSRVLLLGGGDNAVENALYLHARGHQVTVCTRSALRAQPALMERLQRTNGLTVREGEPVPDLVSADGEGVTVASAFAGTERFEVLAVLFGYEPEPAAFNLVRDAMRQQGLPCPALDASSWQLPEAAPAGLFVAGDASGRGHPCVQTALAEGVLVAKQVQQRVKHTLTPEQARALMAPQAATGRGQVLRLTGLRLNGRLGWLDREKHGPQPIQVDTELNMGQQPLLPDDDNLTHVLDYRKVRQIIIDECNAEHSHLIETLLGKLCLRLARLPGVVGVRVQVTKLEIFDDCHVAMSAEHGQW